MTEDRLSYFQARYGYAGKILAGSFGSGLRDNLSRAIVHLDALEKMGSPIIPYIAAWRPDIEHIWYEYTGSRLHSLLGVSTDDLAAAFRANIITRCLYRTQLNPPSVDKIVRDRSHLERMRGSMRRMAERGGLVEAVYKIEVNPGSLWLKDLARIEMYEADGVVLSYGSLTDVTKEMLLEEKLSEIKDELFLHKEKLESLIIERTRELHKAQFEVVSRLTQAAACRDDDTGSHIKRLSLYSGIIGRSYGLSKKANWVLSKAIPMHDVGKIGIDDSILRKQGPLSQDEFEIIKTHCRVGADLLKGGSSALLKVARDIALSHHERWDGSGYPNGLQGRNISLASRIASVCDVFDALTTERPYKPAWTFDEAVGEVERLRNRAFDPRLVDLFMRNLPEIKKVYETAV